MIVWSTSYKQLTLFHKRALNEKYSMFQLYVAIPYKYKNTHNVNI